MPISDIIQEAQDLTRQSLGLPNSTYIAWLNRINRSYCRRCNWPELRKTNQLLTTVANQAKYDLPTDFNRIMGEFVYWNVQAITGGYNLGWPLRFINQGSEEDDSKILAGVNLGTGSVLAPYGVYRATSSMGVPQLGILPFPGESGTLILYNYYADPAPFTTTDDDIPIPTLYDTFVMALCKTIGLYLDNSEIATLYAGMERDAYRGAERGLNFN